MSAKPQRIRDPVHDLIVFASPKVDQLEGVLWQVMQKRPFQRLRRIKQLGFSEFVYPGATHSRFAHSIGVFHTARELMRVVQRSAGVRRESDEKYALAAALLHDLGHGPFSHAFEKVGKHFGWKLANHENVSVELITSGEVFDFLTKEMGKGFAENVADILKKDGVKRVQHAVVSSQFDADRLDYVRRDRMMAGSQHAGIDFRWLVENLEIGEVHSTVDDQKLDPVETFVIGPKAALAAEAYVLGLFQLYPTIYLHKTTRGIEKLFEHMLIRIFTLVIQGRVEETGLFDQHPLVKFAKYPDRLDNVLDLDDCVISGALPLLVYASDGLIRQFSSRIRDRSVMYCSDIRERVVHEIDAESTNDVGKIDRINRCCEHIKKRLTESLASSTEGSVPKWLLDWDERSPYKRLGAGSKGPLDQIWVKTNGDNLVNLEHRSVVVRELRTYQILRAYVDKNDEAAKSEISKAIQEGIANVK
jgi:HD superfamily phosphohydrolase